MNEQATLYVSFWHIHLSNFPSEEFRHLELTSEEAKTMIHDARSSEKFFCVTQDDLFAPYKKRELTKCKEMCDTLRKHFDIDIIIDDFAMHDNGVSTVRPLNIIQINQNHKLLVIDCAYTLSENQSTDEIRPNFQIAPDSIKFHLFQTIP